MSFPISDLRLSYVLSSPTAILYSAMALHIQVTLLPLRVSVVLVPCSVRLCYFQRQAPALCK
jgi:hypothetical protein